MVQVGLGCVAVAALLWLQLNVVATPAHLDSRWTWWRLEDDEPARPGERDCRHVYTRLLRGFAVVGAVCVVFGVVG